MLMPSGKTIFENASSRDYYIRMGELKSKKISGCIFLAYEDFDEAVIFLEGEPVTAMHEAKRWLTVGGELLEPAENKAITNSGRMSAYELPEGLLHIFINKKVGTMVETELGPYMTVSLLIGYLVNDKSTCLIKIEDKRSKGYVYINFGKRVGAVYDSPEGRSYDDKAVKEMESLKGQTLATIYFMEFSEKYLKSKSETSAVTTPPAKARPVQPPRPAVVPPVAAKAPVPPVAAKAPVPPVYDRKPLTPVMKPIMPVGAPVTVVRAPKPKITQVKLVVALSNDRSVGLAHRSKLHTLEALEDQDIAWVDKNTLSAFKSDSVKLVLPGGNEYAITLREAAMTPGDGRYIILPRKLRSRLAVGQGTTVEVKA
jgi:hypothetical protein